MRKWMQRIKNYPLGILLKDLRDFIRSAPREMMSRRRRVRSYKPKQQPVGNVLLCYSNVAFFLKAGQPIPSDHTCGWESWQMSRTFLNLGYRVDVVSEENDRFVPTRHYSVFVGNRTNFHRIAQFLNNDCIKILHIDTCHWLFHNLAEYRRLDDLQKRRGFVLPALRTMTPNLAIEHADYGIVVGNEATISTYRYANKPLFRVPISNEVNLPWPDEKDFDAVRKSFVWFGSHGFVHKGLDVVLEAFADMPEYQLMVCGPLKTMAEKEFVRAYQKELYATKNISPVGWVDMTSPRFLEITQKCIGVVFPSSSEGGSGGVITCMHAGLIPIVTYEAAVDVDASQGIMLPTCSVQDIKAAVQNLSVLPLHQLKAMARKNWELARSQHTRTAFATTYSNTISDIMAIESGRKNVVRAPVEGSRTSDKGIEQARI